MSKLRHKTPKDGENGPRLVDTKPGLEIKHIGKRYAARPVVRDVSLKLRRGEAVGLLGPNGAGK
ncbi:MAG: ATP-binding cassette domain-containing protein, partial [Proteobacteria bacterium]|nr:ATP-binding cassette domain-containing protein [Pseudomonadota bacterium]